MLNPIYVRLSLNYPIIMELLKIQNLKKKRHCEFKKTLMLKYAYLLILLVSNQNNPKIKKTFNLY